MNRIFDLKLLGRFGNCMFQYTFARGYCERHNLELNMDDWVGQRIFQIEHPRCPEDLPRRDEFTLGEGEAEVSYRSYSQQQKCANYYTRKQIKEWFKFRPEISEACEAAIANDCRGGTPDRIICHRRRGDFIPLGYPVLSVSSYVEAAKHYGLDWNHPGVTILSDEDPTPHTGYVPDEMDFVIDFYRMVKAPTLLRANSSFSFWAAALSDGLVLSPEIAHLEGGKEHDVAFIPGNSARLSGHDFVTPIHIREI